ncbi:hypothetical protein RQP46_008304 [Phenoliferia psychrophenolica]
MTTLPSFRPSIPHLASSTSHNNYSHSSSTNHPGQSQPQSANRPIPSPLPLTHQATSASGPVPSLDPSNPDPRSAGSMTSSEGGPPTPSEFPRLAPDFQASNKRRASTTALYHAPRVLLQPIPPFVQRKSFPPARQQDAAPSRSPSVGQPAYPSVFEKPSPSPDGMDLDDNTSLEEGEVGRRGLGISVGSSANGDHSAGSRKRRANDGSDFDPNAISPKQIKREASSSPRPTSATNLSLDTLASAASSLASTSQLHPHLPHPPPSPIVLPLGTPSDPHKASQLANALNLRTQQLREIERRRASNGPSAASAASGMGGLSGALDKLSARAGGPGPSGSTSPPSQDGSEGSGLAKRRGNVAREKTKNLTVLTSSSYGPGGVEAGLKSAPAKAPASRMAPGVTPSVLAGPMLSRGLATLSGNHNAQQMQQQQQQQQLPTPQTAAAPQASSKAAFLSLFSTFYDSLSDSRVLAHTLEDQIRRSSSLLHTLHESGKVFEDMLDKRVKEVVEDMSRDLVLNEGRIVRLEKIIGVGAGAAKGEERDGAMGDRLARLEGMVERLLSEKGGERRRSDEMDQ